jgi:hypothetical protein
MGYFALCGWSGIIFTQAEFLEMKLTVMFRGCPYFEDARIENFFIIFFYFCFQTLSLLQKQ